MAFVYEDAQSGDCRVVNGEEAAQFLYEASKPQRSHRFSAAAKPKHFSPQMLLASMKRNPMAKVALGQHGYLFWDAAVVWYEVLYIPHHLMGQELPTGRWMHSHYHIAHVPAADQNTANWEAEQLNLGQIIDVRKVK